MLHHLEIYVSNLKKSTEFWEWFLTKLGYHQFQKWDQGISWKYQSTYLVFVQAKEEFLSTPYHRCRVGLNHLAFQAQSRKQVDELALEIKERGMTILYSERYPYAGGQNHYALYFEDPDRIKVEVVAPTEEAG